MYYNNIVYILDHSSSPFFPPSPPTFPSPFPSEKGRLPKLSTKHGIPGYNKIRQLSLISGMDLTGIPGGENSGREDAGSEKPSRTSPGTALSPPTEYLVWSSLHGHLPAMSYSPKPTLPQRICCPWTLDSSFLWGQ